MIPDGVQVWDGNGIDDTMPDDLWIHQDPEDAVIAERFDDHTYVQFLFNRGDNPLLEIPNWWKGMLFKNIGSARLDPEHPTTRVNRYVITGARLAVLHPIRTPRRAPGAIFRCRTYEHNLVDCLVPDGTTMLFPIGKVLREAGDQ